jgi:hypothetical protein
MRQKRDKIEATTLEHYASQLKKNLEDRIEKLDRESTDKLQGRLVYTKWRRI